VNTESNENNNEEIVASDADDTQSSCVHLSINIQKELNIDDYADQSDASTSQLNNNNNTTLEQSSPTKSLQRYDSIEYLINVLQGAGEMSYV
jgi:hypothetical protein